MIERIPNLPNNVLGFTAKGKVTSEDYVKVLIPAVEKMLKEKKKYASSIILARTSKVSRRAPCGRTRKSVFRISRHVRESP